MVLRSARADPCSGNPRLIVEYQAGRVIRADHEPSASAAFFVLHHKLLGFNDGDVANVSRCYSIAVAAIAATAPDRRSHQCSRSNRPTRSVSASSIESDMHTSLGAVE
jgi:hypothetical protein